MTILYVLFVIRRRQIKKIKIKIVLIFVPNEHTYVILVISLFVIYSFLTSTHTIRLFHHSNIINQCVMITSDLNLTSLLHRNCPPCISLLTFLTLVVSFSFILLILCSLAYSLIAFLLFVELFLVRLLFHVSVYSQIAMHFFHPVMPSFQPYKCLIDRSTPWSLA